MQYCSLQLTFISLNRGIKAEKYSRYSSFPRGGMPIDLGLTYCLQSSALPAIKASMSQLR
jgi:hypothetical protein